MAASSRSRRSAQLKARKALSGLFEPVYVEKKEETGFPITSSRLRASRADVDPGDLGAPPTELCHSFRSTSKLPIAAPTALVLPGRVRRERRLGTSKLVRRDRQPPSASERDFREAPA